LSLASAIKTGEVAELPSRRDEDWKWTDLRALIRQMPERAGPGHAWGPGLFSQAEADDRLEVVNGVGPTSERLAGFAPRLDLRFIADGAGSSSSVFRLVVGSDVQHAILMETHESRDAGVVASVTMEIDIAPGASLERVVICEDADDAVRVNQVIVRLGAGARYDQTVLTSGARRQRMETQLEHPGQAAEVKLDGVYLNAGQRHSDITTVVTHSGVGGQTSQLIKGVVADQARGVFQGRIVVEHGADKTDAKMGHHALILSERAEVDAKPELEIYADDVACAHGNTVGALDEDALFYALQRGIPEDAARAMLTEAFLAEVIDRIDHEAAREVARAWLTERLGGGDDAL
jgi:Fe-S cluster assembly protein SufD